MLFRQKVRRRQSAGIEMSFIDLNAETGKFLRQFARRPLTGVGQEEKLLLVFVQPVYELGRPGRSLCRGRSTPSISEMNVLLFFNDSMAEPPFCYVLRQYT